ncbi:hypothetical protein HMPREF3190_00907 [Umbribacter vaginalis]|nr:hypothetical protein HMPREF3190_00907 [Coriobacteriales bacterium DNF00809]
MLVPCLVRCSDYAVHQLLLKAHACKREDSPCMSRANTIICIMQGG